MKLPIRIAAEQQVSDALNITKHELERIEAWANFETLKANWYGDEANSPSCQITLVSPEYFDKKFSAQLQTTSSDDPITGFQLDESQTVAFKFAELGSKQLIVISTTDEILTEQLAQTSNTSDKSHESETSQWIGSENAVKLQQVTRIWLLTMATHFGLDLID
ncbi:hypothetical protein [Thalassotalea euphylliae]|uniref:Uncharacterized protein n=1 Tax=Thalassotalea euphylliae TaxID=1655234 RepID=A0A3E0UBH2_9GAMM|nr:hypothetical protein [Thalassotalea euphylliae]REL34358.1 hypothetical protein DXX92_02765 [Thalassotalea euphylliae]